MVARSLQLQSIMSSSVDVCGERKRKREIAERVVDKPWSPCSINLQVLEELFGALEDGAVGNKVEVEELAEKLEVSAKMAAQLGPHILLVLRIRHGLDVHMAVVATNGLLKLLLAAVKQQASGESDEF